MPRIDVARIAATFAVAGLVAAGGCTDSSSGRPEERRITIDDLSDLEVDIEGATGLDLGPIAPPSSLTFCEAVGSAPMRWLNDALAPLQFTVDALVAVDDAPEDLEADVAALVEFGRARLEWNFGGRDERPEFLDVAAAAHAVTTRAVADCDLPPVLGRDDVYLANPFFGEIEPDVLAERCADDRERVAEAVDRFVEAFDRAPGHVAEIETGLLTVGDWYLGSDLHVVTADGERAAVAPVAVGPCAPAS